MKDADSATDSAADSSPIYFFGKDKPNGWLSQFYESPFEYHGFTYNTSEHFFQASKAFRFFDFETHDAITAAKTPSAAKHLGKKVVPFDEECWDEVSIDVAIFGNYLKFTISKHAATLRELLLATGDRELVEADPCDSKWGIGYGVGEAEQNRGGWGYNLLGYVLMQVRRRLKEESQDTSA